MNWYPLLVASGGVAALLTAVAGIVFPWVGRREAARDKLLGRIESAIERNRADTEALTLRIARELGGNSGGIRQEINRQGLAQARHGEQLAKLAGQFEQHMIQGGG